MSRQDQLAALAKSLRRGQQQLEERAREAEKLAVFFNLLPEDSPLYSGRVSVNAAYADVFVEVKAQTKEEVEGWMSAFPPVPLALSRNGGRAFKPMFWLTEKDQGKWEEVAPFTVTLSQTTTFPQEVTVKWVTDVEGWLVEVRLEVVKGREMMYYRNTSGASLSRLKNLREHLQPQHNATFSPQLRTIKWWSPVTSPADFTLYWVYPDMTWGDVPWGGGK